MKTEEEKDKEFKDAEGNYIMCPICGSEEHIDGRCEATSFLQCGCDEER